MAIPDIDLTNIKDPIILKNFQILYDIIKDQQEDIDTLKEAS
jgi:hypothetical protein